MKEIDFLPEWYKSGRRRQMSYRTQYAALACIFVVMLVWNFLTARSVSQAKAELAQEKGRQAQAKNAAEEFTKVRNAVIKLRQKASTITQLDSKIDVASVLGELSFLLDEKVVLSKLGFYAERFAGNQEGKGRAGSAVRVTGGGSGPGRSPLLGDVRFRVVLSGVASDAADVADLICRLEDSAYFCHVIPSFSRNREINAGARLAKEKLQVSEFEISCYLANYHQQDAPSGGQSPQGPKLQ